MKYVFYYGLILCGFFFDLRPEIVHYDHFTRWNVYFDSLNFLNWLKFYYYEPMTGFRLNRFLVTYNWFNDYFLFFRTLHQVKRLVLLFILLKFILKILIFCYFFLLYLSAWETSISSKYWVSFEVAFDFDSLCQHVRRAILWFQISVEVCWFDLQKAGFLIKN